MLAATISPSPTPPLSPSRWTPTGDDHLIFEWVKMQGKTQREVASLFGIDQSTVSRVIQRMERWQAHAKARENGRLDPQERFRAQRWLTYERNELIIASCLRIAEEMEGFTDVSKTTISRPVDKPSQERAILTQHSTIDRHGIASRFLRLAHRINMDQLKLTAQIAKDGDIPLDPLTAEELAAEARQAALDAAQIAAAKVVPSLREGLGDEPTFHSSPETPPTGTESSRLTPGAPDPNPGEPANLTLTLSPSLPPSVSPSAPLHNLHTENAAKIAASATKLCTCVPQTLPEKNPPNTCITDLSQSPWAHEHTVAGSQHGSLPHPLHLQE